ncbi:MAG: hypothetical protein ACUZ8O_11365, partial [Candidatus Anammoxibacter sp.]
MRRFRKMVNMKKTVLTILLSGVFVFSLSSVSKATALIDTTGSWAGSILWFGESDNASSTYGQTFTVTGSETVLDSFTFFQDDSVNPDFVDFEAYVYAWDGDRATGSSLFTSSPMSTTNNGGNDGWEIFTINTGGVTLTTGSQYVAFFTTANMFDDITGSSAWKSTGGQDVYDGGQFVFLNNGDKFGE